MMSGLRARKELPDKDLLFIILRAEREKPCPPKNQTAHCKICELWKTTRSYEFDWYSSYRSFLLCSWSCGIKNRSIEARVNSIFFSPLEASTIPHSFWKQPLISWSLRRGRFLSKKASFEVLFYGVKTMPNETTVSWKKRTLKRLVDF